MPPAGLQSSAMMHRLVLPGLGAVDSVPADADTIVVGVFRGSFSPPGTEDALASIGLDVGTDLRTADFRAHVGEVLTLAGRGDAARVVVCGLGQLNDLTPESLRRAAGAAGRAVATTATHVATTLALVDPGQAFVRAIGEGLLLGVARDQRYKSSPEPATVEQVSVVVPPGSRNDAATVLAAAARHAAGQVIARELVASPAGHLGPQEVVEWLEAQLPEGLDIEFDDEETLRDQGCGALLSVAAGSARPARLIRIHRRADKPVARIALVGKGITFDSGGLSLKPPAGQMVMKKDMGGVATIIAVMAALADSHSPVEVTAWLAMAENMPSGSATRPGDVVTAANGTTIEILNTDAEGRLVMADALALAARTEPDAIIDVATLTGAVQHAVGRRAFGVFGNDDGLLDRVLHAADAAGEAAWHLPLWPDRDESLDTEVADVANVAWGDDDDRGGATIAGLFLQRFVDDVPWVHLDISGASWSSKDRGHLPKNATGVGVRTLLRLLETDMAD
jgi:leucyl aminopeptidase